MEGFKCVRGVFLILNHLKGKIEKPNMKKPVKPYETVHHSGISSITGQYIISYSTNDSETSAEVNFYYKNCLKIFLTNFLKIL